MQTYFNNQNLVLKEQLTGIKYQSDPKTYAQNQYLNH